MANAAATFHELHLLLVNLDDATVRIGVTVNADYKAVAQRANLIVVTDSRHGASLGYNIFKMTDEVKNLLLAHRVWILLFNSGKLGRNAVMHIVGRQFVVMAVRVFQSILLDPHIGCECVTLEVFESGLARLFKCVIFFIVHDSVVILNEINDCFCLRMQN